MKNLAFMEHFETFDNLEDHEPNLLLFNVHTSLLIGTYFLEDIAIVCIFHHHAMLSILNSIKFTIKRKKLHQEKLPYKQ